MIYIIERVHNGYLVRPDLDDWEPDAVRVFQDRGDESDPYEVLEWLRKQLSEAGDSS